MQLSMYSILDIKSGVYSKPFIALNHAVAARTVSAAMQHQDTDLSAHPQDYDLYCIGSFDDQEGILTPQTREHVTSLHTIAIGIQHAKHHEASILASAESGNPAQ